MYNVLLRVYVCMCDVMMLTYLEPTAGINAYIFTCVEYERNVGNIVSFETHFHCTHPHTRSIKFYMKHILVFVLINYISTKELCVVLRVCVWVCGLWKRINMRMIILHIFLYYYAISILTVVNSVANSTSQIQHNATRERSPITGESSSTVNWNELKVHGIVINLRPTRTSHMKRNKTTNGKLFWFKVNERERAMSILRCLLDPFIAQNGARLG